MKIQQMPAITTVCVVWYTAVCVLVCVLGVDTYCQCLRTILPVQLCARGRHVLRDRACDPRAPALPKSCGETGACNSVRPSTAKSLGPSTECPSVWDAANRMQRVEQASRALALPRPPQPFSLSLSLSPSLSLCVPQRPAVGTWIQQRLGDGQGFSFRVRHVSDCHDGGAARRKT